MYFRNSMLTHLSRADEAALHRHIGFLLSDALPGAPKTGSQSSNHNIRKGVLCVTVRVRCCSLHLPCKNPLPIAEVLFVHIVDEVSMRMPGQPHCIMQFAWVARARNHA